MTVQIYVSRCIILQYSQQKSSHTLCSDKKTTYYNNEQIIQPLYFTKIKVAKSISKQEL